MRSLPEQVGGMPAVRAMSVIRALNPHLGLAADGLRSPRVADAALTILAAAFTERGPVREVLLAERFAFDRLVHALHRCPEHREAA